MADRFGIDGLLCLGRRERATHLKTTGPSPASRGSDNAALSTLTGNLDEDTNAGGFTMNKNVAAAPAAASALAAMRGLRHRRSFVFAAAIRRRRSASPPGSG